MAMTAEQAYILAKKSGGGGGGTITVDDHLSETSTNPVQNKVITLAKELMEKGDALVSKNIFKPTLESIVDKGLNIVKNSDSTYTISGTCTSNAWINLGLCQFTKGQYKICGCPVNDVGCYLVLQGNAGGSADRGEGSILTFGIDTSKNVYIYVPVGAVLDNLTFKPMISTDLEVTMNDYEPYYVIYSLRRLTEEIEALKAMLSTPTTASETYYDEPTMMLGDMPSVEGESPNEVI